MSRFVRRSAWLGLLVCARPCLADPPRVTSPEPQANAPAAPEKPAKERPDTLRMSSWGKVDGWILDAVSRKPVAGARVAVEVDGAFPEKGKGTDLADAAGHFEAHAPLGNITRRFDWGRLLTMHPVSLLLSPTSLTKKTKILDVTEVNVRVDAPGYQPFLGRVQATLLDPRDFRITLDEIWLARSGAALASFTPVNLRLEVIDGLTVEPSIAGPGEKVRITLTTHLPVDRGYHYRAYATSTAIRLVDAQVELKREKPAKDAPDPRRLVFTREVTLPKTPVDRWTEIGFFLVRNDTTVLRQRNMTALLQHVRTPEDRAAAEKVLEGYRLERAGEETGALARYAAARKERPGYTLAHLLCGDLAMRLRRPREAVDAYRQLADQDPRDYETARSRYAAALLETGRPADALAQLAGAETVLGKNRLPTPVELVRARIFASQGNFEEADKWLAKAGAGAELPEEALVEINLRRAEAAVKASPNNADLRLTYAHALVGIRRREEAVAQIRRATALEPSQPWAFLDLGTILWDLGQREEAVANLEHAAKLAPQNVEVLLALAGAYRDLARYPDALALYRKATEAQKLNLAARHYYALMLYATGQLKEARRQFIEVIAEAREKGDLRESGVPQAGLYIGPKRRLVAGFSVPEAVADLAILDALQDMDRHPDSGLLWQNIGNALLNLDLPDLALGALRKSAERDAALLETRFLTGVAYRKLGKPAQAERELEAVVAGNPLHPRARLELAQLYTDRGDLDRAQDQLALHAKNYPYQRAPRPVRSFTTSGG